MTACPLCIVLATKLRTLDHRCSLTAATTALVIVCLPPLSSITTPSLVLLAIEGVEEYNGILLLEEYKLAQQAIL